MTCYYGRIPPGGAQVKQKRAVEDHTAGLVQKTRRVDRQAEHQNTKQSRTVFGAKILQCSTLESLAWGTRGLSVTTCCHRTTCCGECRQCLRLPAGLLVLSASRLSGMPIKELWAGSKFTSSG